MLCSGVKCAVSRPPALLVPAWVRMQYLKSPAGGDGVWVTESKESERGIRGGCQRELETRGGKMTGYIFALEFIFLMALVGGELFRGSGEQGGLSTARRAADCRSLVRCLLSSFLLSTSLPACPACMHGLRLTKWRRRPFRCTHTHLIYTSVVGMHIYIRHHI